MRKKDDQAIPVSLHLRNCRLDEATKAGIGATVCSIVILAIFFISLHILPVSTAHTF